MPRTLAQPPQDYLADRLTELADAIGNSDGTAAAAVFARIAPDGYEDTAERMWNALLVAALTRHAEQHADGAS